MSENVIITLIIVVGVVLIAYKNSISSIFFKKDENGTQVGFDAEKKKSGFLNNFFFGSKNNIEITDQTNVQDSTVIGKDNNFSVKSSKTDKKG